MNTSSEGTVLQLARTINYFKTKRDAVLYVNEYLSLSEDVLTSTITIKREKSGDYSVETVITGLSAGTLLQNCSDEPQIT